MKWLTFENESKRFIDFENYNDGSVCVEIGNNQGDRDGRLYWLEPEDVNELLLWLQRHVDQTEKA